MAAPKKKRRYDMSSRAASAAQTRERILQAAVALFREHVFDDVTFPRLAEHAGVSPQTVALHFRTKERLVLALCEWWAPQEDALREMSEGDPLEAARKICARYDDLGPATLRLLAVEDQVPALKPVLDAGRAVHRRWVERTFGAKLGSGAPRRRRLAALVAAYDLYTWHVLRRELGPEDTVVAMAALARGVLEGKAVTR